MSHNPTSTSEMRAAAIRMIAATEYFKAAGELPSWARAELEAWNGCDAIDHERGSLSWELPAAGGRTPARRGIGERPFFGNDRRPLSSVVAPRVTSPVA